MTNIDQQSHQGTRRETYLMGMLIVVGLVFFHSAQIFSGSDFYVVNTQQSELTTLAANLFLGFANMWGMPLMMFHCRKCDLVFTANTDAGTVPAKPRSTAIDSLYHGYGAHLPATGLDWDKFSPAVI